MPDLKIVKFDGVTKLGVSVEDVLDGNKDLEKVYLVGFKDGELVMATSEAGTWGDFLLVLELARNCVIREALSVMEEGGG
ncbi:MAG TPA: hypothetical protein PLR20_15175 [Syntrophales bacterium]|jgi:hypothetical protein|nr:hypothetical protein [Syntrophales bacterium]